MSKTESSFMPERLVEIEMQYNLLIIPFAYDSNYDDVETLFDAYYWSNTSHIRTSSRMPVFNHINELLYGSNKIFKTFSLEQRARTQFGLPNNPGGRLEYINRSKGEYVISLRNIEILLFETNIGFIIFEMTYDKELNKYIDCCKGKIQFLTTELYYKYKNSQYGEVVVKSINISTLKDKILEPLKPKELIFMNEKVLSYNVVYFKDVLSYDLIADYINKIQCLPSNSEISDLKHFGYSHWNISTLDITILICKDNENDPNDLMQINQCIMKDYFILYLFALNQKYSLLQYSDNFQNDFYLLNSEENIDVFKIKESMALFIAKYSFNHISSNMEVDNIYGMIRSSLCIDDLISDLFKKVEILNSIIEVKNERRRIELDNKKELFNNRIIILSTIFVIISTAASVWSMVINIYNNEPAINSVYFIILVVTLLIVCGGGFIILLLWNWLSNRLKRIRKN